MTPPAPTRLGEVSWLEPFPDAFLDEAPSPDLRYERTESISLTFVTALQLLPHRQVAALLLCDVLGFEAKEVADMLDTSVDAVNSALKRARAKLLARRPDEAALAPPTSPPPELDHALVTAFARAWESADVAAVVRLLTDDVFISMPPFPNEYEGRDVATEFFASLFVAGRRFALLPTRANGQPAFGAYLRTADGTNPGVGLFVLGLRAEGICTLVRFEHQVMGWFGLPPTLPHP